MKVFFGGLLLATGILIAGASGLCTIAFWVIALSEGPSGAAEFIVMSLVIGGIPFAIGLGLLFWGRSLLRSARAEQVIEDQGISNVDP